MGYNISSQDSFSIGKSVEGRPIHAYSFGRGECHILFLSGVHGDETEGVDLSKRLLGEFSQEFLFNVRLTMIPSLNPDGVFSNKRVNARGVDLNRNLPTRDWSPDFQKDKYKPGAHPASEPENRALLDFFFAQYGVENPKISQDVSHSKQCVKMKRHPKLVVSFHSWKPLININGSCHKEAQFLSKQTGYEVVEDIGYPTPGSLGTYCGLERDIPTITYEIEKGSINLDIHHKAVLGLLKLF